MADTTCRWTYDPDTDSWDTACDEKFLFDVDGPDENRYQFCPQCGGKIELTPYEAPAQEADDDDAS